MFLQVPKNASSSIRHAFGTTSKTPRVNLNTKNGLRGYKKFAIIRNPNERFVSGLIECLGSTAPSNLKELRRKSDIELLTGFLNVLEKGFFEPHTAPQVAFLINREGKLFDLDELLIFENLDVDFKLFCQKHGIKVELGHRNVNVGTIKARRDRLIDIVNTNQAIRKRVEMLYHEDWVLYGKTLLNVLKRDNRP